MKKPLERVSFFLGRRSWSGRFSGHHGGARRRPADSCPPARWRAMGATRSSPAFADSSISSPVSRKKNTGRERSSPRPRWDPLLGPRDDEDGSRRAVVEWAFGKMQSFALRRLGFLGRASSGKELRYDTWMLYRALGKRFGKQIPESTGSVRWEISRPSPTRSRREEGDERRPVGPACQQQGGGKERAQGQTERGEGVRVCALANWAARLRGNWAGGNSWAARAAGKNNQALAGLRSFLFFFLQISFLFSFSKTISKRLFE